MRRGAVRVDDVEEYLQHPAEIGVREYREASGNLIVLELRRPQEGAGRSEHRPVLGLHGRDQDFKSGESRGA